MTTPTFHPGQQVRIVNGGPKDGYVVTVVKVNADAHGAAVHVAWWDTFREEVRTGALFPDELAPVDCEGRA